LRLARALGSEGPYVGLVTGDRLECLAGSWTDVLERCTGPNPEPRIQELLTGDRRALSDSELLAPISDSNQRVFCTGMNYAAHESEAGSALATSGATRPIIFLKTLDAIAAPFADLPLGDGLSAEFDWEVELGAVIGRGGRAIEPDDVENHLAGFTVVNDITARDLQHDFGQWFIGKNVDGSSPIGPCVTTLDEVGYPPSVALRLSVNGVEKQNAKTTDMVHDVAMLISTVSRYIGVRPGDIFATGTPAGVGFTRRPPEFLRAGDVVEAQIERVGALRNVVR
jgi:2-keto-4-pentenoate hydratase/2-oxohepta-3-ene-1,7-dioic acid hydratase in catechol pathway